MDENGRFVKQLAQIPPDIQWISSYHKILMTAFNTLLSKGIDLCGIAMQIVKEAGIPLYLSVRASDNHGWSGMGTAFLDKNALPENRRPDYSRQCVQTYFLSGCDKRYPIRIEAGESATITIYTGKPAMQYRLYLCSADSNAYTVLLNGQPMSPLLDELTIPGFEKPVAGDVLPVRYCRAQFDNFVQYASAQRYEDILCGYNTFTITNTGSSAATISWIEVDIR